MARLVPFGEPVHYSVFRCDLTGRAKVDMISVLTELIQPDEDRIMIIDLGPVEGRIEERIVFLGVQDEHKERKIIIE